MSIINVCGKAAFGGYCEVHTNKRLSKQTLTFDDADNFSARDKELLDKAGLDIVKSLFNEIEGIKQIFVGKYEMTIFIGKMFDASEIAEKSAEITKSILQFYYAPEEAVNSFIKSTSL